MSEVFKLLIIAVYAFLVYRYYKNTTLLLLFTLATILILCNINKFTEGNLEFSEVPNNNNNNSKNSNNNNSKNSNNSNNTNTILPISSLTDYQMGPYDNLVLTTGNPKSEYVKLQTNSLSTEKDVCVYQGNENPLKCKKTLGLDIGPSIDGEPGSPKSLFPFTFNKSSPDCCPSTFSTSTGCVCTTENQRQFINRRGMGIN